jgi:hypothetical protein
MRLAPTSNGRVTLKVRVFAWPIRWDTITTCLPGKFKKKLYMAVGSISKPLAHTGLTVSQLFSEMAAADDLCCIY